MKRLPYWLIPVVALAIAGACAWLYVRPRDPVTVTLVNASHKPVARVLLVHDRGEKVVESIPIGKSRVVTFPTRGETSYVLTVEFADGTTVRGQGSYAESGYRLTDTISDSAVSNHVDGGWY